MKEYTIITTVEITDIFETDEEFTSEEWAEQYAVDVKEELKCDHVEVKNVKIFEREL